VHMEPDEPKPVIPPSTFTYLPTQPYSGRLVRPGYFGQIAKPVPPVVLVPPTINIPGMPRLYSRGKDSFFCNKWIDHFGVVFATGPDGEPQPSDWVFELQVGSGHTKNPVLFHKFCNGEVPVLRGSKFDSKEQVVARLDAFYKKPRKWMVWFNCEHFARWLMNGIAQSEQVEKAVEITMKTLEGVATVLGKMAEMHLKALEQQKEREAALALQKAAAPLPLPPPPVMPTLPAPTYKPPGSGMKPNVMGKPVDKRKKPAKPRRKKPD
jgi:hypothetical protein